MDTKTTHISKRCRPFVASAIVVLALLSSVGPRTPVASGTERAGAAFTQIRTVAHRHGVRPGYGWPVKPFNRQHPVRAYLNDPRNGHGDAKSFHFGIDISAPNGTPVYAVEAGKVFLTRGRMAVAVQGAKREFGYWHVKPAVRNHQLVRVHQLIGYVYADGTGQHVHLAEHRHGEYMNPLRPGGIGPYVDRTPPTVASIEFLHNGQEVAPDKLTGKVDIVAEIFDRTPILVPAPWSHMPVTAARIRWSIANHGQYVVGARTTINSDHMLAGKLYDRVFAAGTTQNYIGAPGHYRYYLIRSLNTARLPDGLTRLRIDAYDTRGNRVVANAVLKRA